MRRRSWREKELKFELVPASPRSFDCVVLKNATNSAQDDDAFMAASAAFGGELGLTGQSVDEPFFSEVASKTGSPAYVR